jgi:sodium transport system permease protein
VFPCSFVLAGSLARSPELPMSRKLEVNALITIIVFGGIPVLLAMFGRVRTSSGLGLRRAGPGVILAAAILGIALWPAAHEIFLLSERFGLAALGSKQAEQVEAILEQLKTQPYWLIVTTLALVPAIFEEVCFRGFLFGALRTRLTGPMAVVASALLFGLFHEILSPLPGRLLPSAFLGLVLGWVRLRSRSILPGMVLHALNNGLLLSVIYFRDELLARGWGIEQQQHLPITWDLLALVGIAVGAVLLVATTRSTYERISESSSTDLAASRY